MANKMTIPPAAHEWRISTENNFTGETLDYKIPLPPDVALVYNHFVNTAIAAVISKAGEVLTQGSLEGSDCEKVAAVGELVVQAVSAVPSK